MEFKFENPQVPSIQVKSHEQSSNKLKLDKSRNSRVPKFGCARSTFCLQLHLSLLIAQYRYPRQTSEANAQQDTLNTFFSTQMMACPLGSCSAASLPHLLGGSCSLLGMQIQRIFLNPLLSEVMKRPLQAGKTFCTLHKKCDSLIQGRTTGILV